MSRVLLIVRPEPGASSSAAAARARGWEPVVAPLFVVRALQWTPPDPAGFDALLLTSANAARYGGDGLRALRALPVYAVGESTARAAREACVSVTAIAGGTADAAAALIRAAGHRSVLHLAGRDARGFEEAWLAITRIAVYAADEVAGPVTGFSEALARQPVVLLHSVRAAQAFARRVGAADADRATIALVGVSAHVLAAAGGGWRAAATAATPHDDAMLDAAGPMVDQDHTGALRSEKRGGPGTT